MLFVTIAVALYLIKPDLFIANNDIRVGVKLIGYLFQSCVIISILIAYQTFKDWHDYSRRKTSLDIMFAHSHDSRIYTARKVIRKLNDTERKKLINYELNEIDKDLIDYVKVVVCGIISVCCKNCDSCLHINKNSHKVGLSDEVKIVLRNQVIAYLNTIESIAVAYFHNIADRELIMEQFAFIAKDEENYWSMITSMGMQNGYPCTKEFIDDFRISERRKAKSKTGYG